MFSTVRKNYLVQIDFIHDTSSDLHQSLVLNSLDGLYTTVELPPCKNLMDRVFTRKFHDASALSCEISEGLFLSYLN